MTDKRNVRFKIRRLEQVKTWQLLILFVMFAFITATFLRLNNVGMVERREAVYAADKTDDSVGLASRLYDLQRFVSAHMNADPGRVALVKPYERDNERHKKAYQESSNSTANGDAFQKAEAVCGPIARSNGWRWPDMRYTNCINQELEKIPGGQAVMSEFKPLPVEPYYHTFTSPLWSPDFAGWSLIITAVIGLIIIGRLVILAILRFILRRRKRF